MMLNIAPKTGIPDCFTLAGTMHHSTNIVLQMITKAIIALIICCDLAHASDNKWVPELDGHITDVANLLTSQDREALTGMLASYEQETQHQLAVLIIPTLSGEPIESFSFRVANTWKLGQKYLDNGILVTLAIKERNIRIELGPGMQRYISDEKAAAIINEQMKPAFRRGDFAAGLKSGLIELMNAGKNYVVPAPIKAN